MDQHNAYSSFDTAEYDRILARVLATELPEEARAGEGGASTAMSTGTEECEDA
jgi:hypothetical protein